MGSMVEPSPDRITKLVRQLGGGDAAVAEELLPLVYEELRTVARSLFARQASGHTLQPTALVHEAWLKVAGAEQEWETRSHFFSVAARAMRQVLTDHARARRTDRRGEGWRKLTFDDELIGRQANYDLVELDEALEQLGQTNERYVRVAELRLFAGLTVDEVAKVLGVTSRTVQLDWRSARAYLSHVLGDAS